MFRPFLYGRGNTLATLSYMSLAAQYAEGASRSTRANGVRFGGESAALDTLFEVVVLILYGEEPLLLYSVSL